MHTHSFRDVLFKWRTLVLFVMVVVLLSAPFVLYIEAEREAELDATRLALNVEYETQLEQFSGNLAQRFGSMSLLAMLVADSRVLLNYIKGKKGGRKTLLDTWSRLMFGHGELRQIRYIGEDGYESVRVDYSRDRGPVVVKELQYKGDRDYFKYAQSMTEDYSFYGADLEMENGEFVEPYQMALRIIVPVYIEAERIGFLIVNIAVSSIFDNQISRMNLDDSPVVFGKTGHYLYGVESFRLFGMRLDERSIHTLANERPELWDRVLNDGSGVFTEGPYHTVFDRFTIPFPGLGEANLGILHDYDETRVQQLAQEALNGLNKFQTVGLLIICLLSIPLAALLSYRRESAGQERLAYAAIKTMSPILVVNKKGYIQQANESYCRMVDKSLEQLIGKKAHIFKQEEMGRLELADEISQELEKNGEWEGEIVGATSYGEDRIEKVEIFSIKGLHSESLDFVISFDDITEEKRLTHELEMLTVTDSLTGCRNRRYYDEVIRRQVLTFNRYSEQHFCLALIDIDHFKRVNDEFGHDVGDEVLKKFAAILRDSVRSVDVVCRVGGEEFAIILPNTDESNAHGLLERIRASVQTADIYPKVTCSIGYTEGVKDATEDALYQLADRALYNAKNKGRNRVVCAQ